MTAFYQRTKIFLTCLFKVFVVFVFCSNIPLYSQIDDAAKDVNVTQMTFEEELTDTDELEAGFGRFDVFEIAFNFGDRILLTLSSPDFSPTLVLISPQEEDFMQFPKAGEKSVTYEMTIPRTGNWLLVVRGDSLAKGRYHLSCWWAEYESLKPKEDADLCDQINFIFAHANADFFFLKKPRLLGSPENVWQPTSGLEGAIHTEIVSAEDEVYRARMHNGNDKNRAREIYSNLVTKIKFCNNETWPGTFKDWYQFDVFNSLQKMEYQINEDEREDYRYVRIEIVDFSGAAAQFSSKYAVDVVIGRHKPLAAK